MVIKVGINGFGRVGKCLFRVNYEEKNPEKKYEIAVIKDVIPIDNIAYLLKHDSTYGTFEGDVKVKGNNIVVDGKEIPYFNEKDMTKVPWNDLGVNTLIESSGAVTSDVARSIIKGPLKNVIYARNVEGADYTFVMGVNNNKYNPKSHKLISSSTCTGNSIVPIAKIINDNFGIENGHLVTIHPVLSDQKLLDVSHEKFNLGRNANTSIIPTSTAVSHSLGIILPELKGKMTAISYRVPTNIVSAIDATFRLNKKTTVEEVNTLFKKHVEGEMKGIINYDEGYLNHPKVSIDFFKSPYSVIFLALETQVSGKNLSISLFHDNEWGYCCRVHELINYIHKKNSENDQ